MIRFNEVTKRFGNGVVAVDKANLSINDGEFLFITGVSGAGKTTLLRLLIRDLLPTNGEIFINELNITKIPGDKISHLRRKIGMVFQDFKVIFDRTVFENITLALEILHLGKKEIEKKAEEVLKMVGLSEQRWLFPVQLSGGELQRTVIARAMIAGPAILLADEPTGNLDPMTSWEIVKILCDINKKGTTVIMATHNVDIVNSVSRRTIEMDKGKIIRDEKKGKY